jgi:hypothetical protein
LAGPKEEELEDDLQNYREHDFQQKFDHERHACRPATINTVRNGRQITSSFLSPLTPPSPARGEG